MRLIVVSLVVSLAAGCASHRVDPLAPKIEIAQLSGETELYMTRGGLAAVRYAVRISNPSSEPLTLRQLDLRTVGSSPYLLRQGAQFFKQVVPAHKSVTFPISVWATVGRGRFAATEPVIIRGVATFKTATGSKQTIFTQTVQQGGGDY